MRLRIVADDMRRFTLRPEGAGRHTITAEASRTARNAIDILAGNPNAWPVGGYNVSRVSAKTLDAAINDATSPDDAIGK